MHTIKSYLKFKPVLNKRIEVLISILFTTKSWHWRFARSAVFLRLNKTLNLTVQKEITKLISSLGWYVFFSSECLHFCTLPLIYAETVTENMHKVNTVQIYYPACDFFYCRIHSWSDKQQPQPWYNGGSIWSYTPAAWAFCKLRIYHTIYKNWENYEAL